MYLLDTNICIYAMKNKYPDLTERLYSIHPDQIRISSVTAGELAYGAAKSKWSAQTLLGIQMFLSSYEILPFDLNDALVFGQLRATLQADGTPIGAYDTMIAAQGIARRLIIVTHNTKEFERVPGVQLEDWV